MNGEQNRNKINSIFIQKTKKKKRKREKTAQGLLQKDDDVWPKRAASKIPLLMWLHRNRGTSFRSNYAVVCAPCVCVCVCERAGLPLLYGPYSRSRMQSASISSVVKNNYEKHIARGIAQRTQTHTRKRGLLLFVHYLVLFKHEYRTIPRSNGFLIFKIYLESMKYAQVPPSLSLSVFVINT